MGFLYILPFSLHSLNGSDYFEDEKKYSEPFLCRNVTTILISLDGKSLH
jgi:hypothetical protein